MTCDGCEYWRQLVKSSQIALMDLEKKYAMTTDRKTHELVDQVIKLKEQLAELERTQNEERENRPPFLQEMEDYFLDQQNRIEKLERQLENHFDSHYPGD